MKCIYNQGAAFQPLQRSENHITIMYVICYHGKPSILPQLWVDIKTWILTFSITFSGTLVEYSHFVQGIPN